MAILTDPQANIIRLGRATNIRYAEGVLDIQWLDRISGSRKNLPMPYPYAGRGWGVLCGVEEGTICVVSLKTNQPYIVATIPHSVFFNDDVEKLPQTAIDEVRYHVVRRGEIVLQSKANSLVFLDQLGNIELSTPEGNIIQIDRERDAINQISARRFIQCETGIVHIGQVARDIRSPEQRENDVVFSGFEDLQTSGMFDRIVALDPLEDVTLEKEDPPRGTFDPRIGSTGSRHNESTQKNPALTEWNIAIKEFSDGNIGIDDILLTDEERAEGFLPANDLMYLVAGTVVNDVGRQVRFDYGFGDGGHGHGKIFASKQFFDNTEGYSTDFKYNSVSTLDSSQPDPTTFEWTVNRLNEVDFAAALRFVIHTKGADYQGRTRSTAFRGSSWSLQVDKEGFTKINIPAATDGGVTDDGGVLVERFRRGRSLLLNMDGSATIAIGKENTTTLEDEDNGLKGITEVPLLNRRDSREDRSLTLDTLGNIEAHIGGDEKSNQSLLAALDGSVSLLVGKENLEPEEGFAVLTEAYNDQGQGRTDRSLTGSFLGNIELLIGMDEATQQSLIVQTLGGNHYKFGEDIDNHSIVAETSGNVKATVGMDGDNQQSIILETLGGNLLTLGKDSTSNSLRVDAAGGVKLTVAGANDAEYAIEIDASGKLKLIVSDEMEIEAKETFLETKTLHIKGDVEIEGDVDIDGELSVSKDTGVDGALTVKGSTTLQSNVTLGAMFAIEGVVKGLSLIQYLASHIHMNGNMGSPTTPPVPPPTPSILSTKVKVS